MMTIEEIIEKYTNENGFLFGIDTVMQCLRPGAIYSLSCEGGAYTIVEWSNENVAPPPTSDEIVAEYKKHETIYKTLLYVQKQQDKSLWQKLVKRLIRKLEKTI